MKLLLHTIALEPARWTPQRTSLRLVELFEPIAESGFDRLEIYEPHLDDDADEILAGLRRVQIQPVILSSYLNLNPAETSNIELKAKLDLLVERIRFFGFKKLRLFSGLRMSLTDSSAIAEFTARVATIANQLPQTEVLLETHDGSLADDPSLIVRVVEELALPNLGLLYQPTLFNAESPLEQLAVQKHLIRHIHLQNRNPDRSFTTLRDGVIPWKSIVTGLSSDVDATLEFVPVGICPLEEFNLAETLAQVRSEAEFARELTSEL